MTARRRCTVVTVAAPAAAQTAASPQRHRRRSSVRQAGNSAGTLVSTSHEATLRVPPLLPHKQAGLLVVQCDRILAISEAIDYHHGAPLGVDCNQLTVVFRLSLLPATAALLGHPPPRPPPARARPPGACMHARYLVALERWHAIRRIGRRVRTSSQVWYYTAAAAPSAPQVVLTPTRCMHVAHCPNQSRAQGLPRSSAAGLRADPPSPHAAVIFCHPLPPASEMEAEVCHYLVPTGRVMWRLWGRFDNRGDNVWHSAFMRSARQNK